MITFPRDPYVEMFLGDDWRDLSADVRQSPAITITQGRKDWASKASPAKCLFTLDDGPAHGDGDYHPDNALGQWYGTLSRNTPVRVGLRYGEDQFDRTVASGWGTGPMGAWATTAVGTATAAVTPGAATHSVTTTSSFIRSNLPGLIKNVDLAVTVDINWGEILGGAVEPANLIVRQISGGVQYYMIRLTLNPGSTITMQVMTDSGVLSGTVTAPMLYTGQLLRVRYQADANTFRGKVWNATDGEPVGWTVEYSHGAVWEAGTFGIRSGVASGNSNTKPIVFTYSDFQVKVPRFAGEVATMTPTSEEDHTNQRTAVECAGIMRRLGRSTKPLPTALEQYLTSGSMPFVLRSYHPLDDDVDSATPGRSAIGNEPAKFARSISAGSVKWGQDTKRLSVERAVELKQGGILSIDLNPLWYGVSWAATWTQRLPADSIATVYVFTSNPNNFYQFTFGPAGSVTVDRVLSGAPSALFGLTPATFTGDDNAWANIGFSAQVSGGSTEFLLSFEGTEGVVYSTTLGVAVSERPVQIAFIANDSDPSNTITIGQVATYSNALFSGSPVLISLIQERLNGFAREPAGTRFARLADQERVPYAMAGYPTITQHMGGQSRKTLLQLMTECADVDQAILYEPLGSRGLALRTGRALISQTGTAVLDYAGGHITRPFAPVTGDQGVVNDVTAKRVLGGEFHHAQETGPLNVQDPGTDPDAVGLNDQSVTVNCAFDGDLIDIAAWRVHQGTAEDSRFPSLTVNLGATELIADNLTVPLLDTGIGDPIIVQNLAAARIYEDVRLQVQGWTEVFDTAYRHMITYNAVPLSPYDGTTIGSSAARLNSDATTTTAAFMAGTDTSMAIITVGALWTVDPANYPLTIRAAGVVLTVTACAGTTQGAGQTFAVSTSVVNGITKTIPSGTPVFVHPKKYLVP